MVLKSQCKVMNGLLWKSLTEVSLNGWLNSNNRPTCEPSTSIQAVAQDCDIATPMATHRTPEICREPLGSQALIISGDRNPFLSGCAQPGAPTKALSKPAENPPTPVEDNPLRYTFRTPSTTGPSFNPSNPVLISIPSSKASAETGPDSTVTKIRKESQAAREAFRSSLTQLSQVHSRLAWENSEHVLRADVIIRDIDELKKSLLEIQAEGRQNQEQLEASMASLNELIKQRENVPDSRMAEMSAVMRERDRQADERKKVMSDMMQRRDTDANIRMVDLMTTMKDLTLGVRAIVSQTTAAQTQVAPVALLTLSQANMLFISAAPPPAQATYRKIAQSSVEQVKPPKLVPPATSKRDPAKTSKMAKVAHADSRDAGTDPMTDVSSFDPFARGASTTGDFYSAASGMTTRRSDYHTAYNTAVTCPQKETFTDLVPRPVATSTQRKITAKQNLEQNHGEIEEVPQMSNETPDTPRTRQRQALAGAISTTMSKGVEPLLAVTESKNKPTKYRETKDGNADGWKMLMKRHLEKAQAKATSPSIKPGQSSNTWNTRQETTSPTSLRLKETPTKKFSHY